MKPNRNSRGRIFLSIKLFALGLMLCAVPFFLLILYPADKANGGPYLNSAHGSSYGVKRSATGFPNDYAIGNCAHCHEQHASIGGAEPDPAGGPDNNYALMSQNFDTSATTKPYAQSDNVCFYCHIGSGTFQQSPAFYNNSYSTTFGGGNPAIIPPNTDNILDAFNSASSHNLKDVLDFAKGEWPATFKDDSNPCSACHNVHIAKRSCGKPSLIDYDPTKSAISRPTDHGNLWGDDASERMMIGVGAGNTYRAPFYVGANPASPATLHEPDGQSSRDINSLEVKGSTTPDYNTFCLDCHHEPIFAAGIGAIPWNLGDANFAALAKHGKKNATNSFIPLIITDPFGYASHRAPYTLDGSSSTVEDNDTNFVLSCLDCHEPHGSQTTNGEYLLRTTVNGVSGITYAGSGMYYYLCNACHANIIINHIGIGSEAAAALIDCRNCHAHKIVTLGTYF